MSRDDAKALGTRIDKTVLKRLDDASYSLRLTKKVLVTRALQELLALLESEHNEGLPFAGRPAGEGDATLGKRTDSRVADKPRTRPAVGEKRKGDAPARSRRRRARR